tara:strand:- start:1722 stop:2201 length:480 start_codon:yes stop_codon:yes gene_type:complete
MESNLIKLEKDFTLQLEQLQNQIVSLNLEGVYVGTDSEEIAPLKHTFAEGLLTREMFSKKGNILIGKIHKYKHTWFLMKGKILMGSPTGNKEITAPAWGTSPAGTKRIAYVLEDCIFINVFPDLENTKNIESIVDNVSFDTYAGFEEFALQQNLIKKIN